MCKISSDFLENENEIIEFNSSKELFNYFNNKDFRAPFREHAGLKDDHGERYTLSFYLRILTNYDFLEFPFRISKSESPDFTLSFETNKVGLEVRQATTTEIERDKTLINPNTEYRLIELSPNGHNLVKDGEALSSSGFYGNQDTMTIAGTVLEGVERKTKNLNMPDYNRMERNELVILDTYGLVIDSRENKKYEELLEILGNSVVDFRAMTKYETYFDSVSFLKNGILLYDLGNKCKLLRLV